MSARYIGPHPPQCPLFFLLPDLLSNKSPRRHGLDAVAAQDLGLHSDWSLTQLPLQQLVICSTKIPNQLGCPFPILYIYIIYLYVALLSYQLWIQTFDISIFFQPNLTRKKLAQMSSSCMSNVHVMSKNSENSYGFFTNGVLLWLYWPSFSHWWNPVRCFVAQLDPEEIEDSPAFILTGLGLGICKTTKWQQRSHDP